MTTIPATTTTTEAVESGLGIEAWREDLQAFQDQIESIHPDLYWRFPEERWEREFAALESQLGELDDRQIALEFVHLAAMLDGHSTIPPNDSALDFRYYALNLWSFPEGFFITEAYDPSFVGARILSIGGVPIDEVYDRMAYYAPHDNDASLERAATANLVVDGMLWGQGVVRDDLHEPGFELELADGAIVTVHPPRLTPDEYGDRFTFRGFLPDREAGPVPIDGDYAFWWGYLPDDRALYLQYNRVAERSRQPGSDQRLVIRDLVSQLGAAVDELDVGKVVIDLRFNPGGNNQSYGRLLDFLADDERIAPPGVLNVLTSRLTFSAATNFVTELQRRAPNETILGEPTGGSPNLYGDVVSFRLPNSGLQVFVSAVFWEFGGPDDNRPWVAPDVDVPFTAKAWFGGADPVLEAALAGRP